MNGSDLETSSLPCPARDASALASGAFPLILEAQIKDAFEQAKTLTRDDQLDQGDSNT